VLDRVRAWRRAQPDITLRSTFIVGFPGETDAEFDELLAFVAAAELDRVGCFAYSAVAGAAANALPGAVPEPVKEERRARLMAAQADISAARLRAKVGRELDVLIDDVDADRAIARTSADAPEIDGVVHISNVEGMRAGSFARVLVTSSDAHDLRARRAA
jgi:ribosomal protein S12 methylthiotransferase